MKRSVFFTGCILSFCLLFTSCSELLNGVWSDKDGSSSSSSSSGGSTTTTTTTTTTTSTTYGVFANTTWKKSFTDETDVITFNSNGMYEWNQDDLTSADVDFTYKGTYTVSGNEVTLTSLTYAKSKLGAAWTGSCTVKRYMYLLDGVFYLDVTKRTGSGTSIVGSWTKQSFRVYYDSDSSYDISGISALTTTRSFTTSGTVSETNVEKYTYNNTADGTDNTTYDSGTYTTSGTTATVVFKSDNSTAVYYRDGNDLCYVGSGAASTTLSAPSGLIAGSTTSTSVSLSWNAVTGAAGYKVYYGTSSTASSMSLAGSTTDPSYVVTGLTADTKYYFCVSAYNTVTESSYSSFTDATTTNSTASAPENVVFTETSSNYTSYKNLSWSTVDSAQKYKVYIIGPSLSEISETSNDWKYYATFETPTIPIFYKGPFSTSSIQPNEYYKFCVVTVYKDGTESIKSKPVSIGLNQWNFIDYKIPRNIKVENITENSIKLSWDKADCATSYKIYQSDTCNGNYTYLATSYIPEYTISNISPGIEKFYEISAISSYGESTMSNYCQACMLPIPKNLTIVSSSSSTVTLSWNKVINADNYVIFYGTTEAADEFSEYTNNTNLEIDNLSSEKSYYFTVKSRKQASINSDFYSDKSNIVIKKSIYEWTYPESQPYLTWKGSGSESDPYIILTAQQFADFAYEVNTGTTYSEKYISLEADIDLNYGITITNTTTNANKWIPIGKDAPYVFKGTFNGKLHKINGLYIIGFINEGLFGYVDNGTIENVIMGQGYISTPSNITYESYSKIGAIAGWLTGNMYSCGNEMTNIHGGDSTYLGGLVGYLKGNIYNSYNKASITKGEGSSYSAGIAGISKEITKIYNCYNSGDINSLGGIVGYIGAPSSGKKSTYIYYCYYRPDTGLIDTDCYGNSESLSCARYTTFSDSITGYTTGTLLENLNAYVASDNNSKYLKNWVEDSNGYPVLSNE